MKNKIRMIGMDLDGTLLKTNKELTAYTKRCTEKSGRTGNHCHAGDRKTFFRHSERADQAAGNPLCSYCKWSKSHRYEEK